MILQKLEFFLFLQFSMIQIFFVSTNGGLWLNVTVTIVAAVTDAADAAAAAAASTDFFFLEEWKNCHRTFPYPSHPMNISPKLWSLPKFMKLGYLLPINVHEENIKNHYHSIENYDVRCNEWHKILIELQHYTLSNIVKFSNILYEKGFSVKFIIDSLSSPFHNILF